MNREPFEALARALGLSDDDTEALWGAASSMTSTVRFETDSATWDPSGAASTEERAGVAVVGRADRYEDLGPLGAGAVGEVRKVRDRDLNRVVAMKTLRRDRRGRPRSVQRFLAEAQATAQLQHPGIVPVHELGVHEDGRLYYTMREVRGRTLRHAIRSTHRLGPSALRRAVGWIRSAADAVGYAHSRGVVHRDLKPDNVLVGEHGEVLVVDWGLARVSDAPDEVHVSGALQTRQGTIAGTPAYMAPEQALGHTDRIGPWTDAWALGAMIYEVLSSRPPYVGRDGDEVIEAIREGPPLPLQTWTSAAPPELAAIVERALQREPEDRYPDGSAVSEALGRWLDGSLQRERALTEVEASDGEMGRAEELEQRAADLRTRAGELLEGVPPWAPEEEKAPGWELLDQADAAEHEARLARDAASRALQSALTHFPELPEAHEALADRARSSWERAEGDAAARAVALERLRAHVAALPEDNPGRWRHAAFLRGTGAVTLITDPEGARVDLYRYTRRNRRLVPELVGELGRTPLVEVDLEPGSWLLRIHAQGRAVVDYPVAIGRAEHWHGVPPGGTEASPIPLPTEAELGGQCYVPAGWYRSGGDPLADSSLPGRQLWCGGLIARRFVVRHDEYCRFLDRLAARDGLAEAEKWYPRERASSGAGGSPLVGVVDGRHVAIPDPEGEVLEPDWPQNMLDLSCKLAFARFERETSGLPWRLPTELELEKARRGVDGRWWPWGNAFDPSWACVRDSDHEGRPKPMSVERFPVDCSVYGVRGVAGNVLQATVSRHGADGDFEGQTVRQPSPDDAVDLSHEAPITVIGGLFHGTEKHSRCAARYAFEPTGRISNWGFRLVRTWPAP